MSDVNDREKQIVDLCFSKDAVSYPDLDARGQQTYRHLVRKSITAIIKHDLPSAFHLLTETQTEVLLSEFLRTSPPRTRLYPRITMEFVHWMMHDAQPLLNEHDLPPALTELMHWESAVIDIERSLAENSSNLPSRPAEHLGVCFHGSTRLLVYQYDVHRHQPRGDSWPTKRTAPFFVIAYRYDERVKWAEIPTPLGLVLSHVSEEIPLKKARESVREQYQHDMGWDDMASWLERFQNKGAILGFPRIQSAAERLDAAEPKAPDDHSSGGTS